MMQHTTWLNFYSKNSMQKFKCAHEQDICQMGQRLSCLAKAMKYVWRNKANAFIKRNTVLSVKHDCVRIILRVIFTAYLNSTFQLKCAASHAIKSNSFWIKVYHSYWGNKTNN